MSLFSEGLLSVFLLMLFAWPPWCNGSIRDCGSLGRGSIPRGGPPWVSLKSGLVGYGVERRSPSQVKGVGLRCLFLRNSWVRIPPSAPVVCPSSPVFLVVFGVFFGVFWVFCWFFGVFSVLFWYWLGAVQLLFCLSRLGRGGVLLCLSFVGSSFCMVAYDGGFRGIPFVVCVLLGFSGWVHWFVEMGFLGLGRLFWEGLWVLVPVFLWVYEVHSLVCDGDG
jgi:hypothetical protein